MDEKTVEMCAVSRDHLGDKDGCAIAVKEVDTEGRKIKISWFADANEENFWAIKFGDEGIDLVCSAAMNPDDLFFV